MTHLQLHDHWLLLDPRDGASLPATVPGCVHTDLHRAGRIPDPFYGRNERDLQWIEEEDWTYRLVFNVPEALLQEDVVDLVAEGLDTVAKLRLNGEMIAESSNMFTGLRIPVKSQLNAGENHLEIHFESPMCSIRARQPKLEPMNCDAVGGRHQIRKQQCSFGWDWGPRFATSGIWRPLRLEGWSVNRLESLHIRQIHDGDGCTLRVDAELAVTGRGLRLRARLTGQGTEQQIEGSAGEDLRIAVQTPQLWWPKGMGSQPIYTLRVELFDRDTLLDQREQRIGLCRLELDQHPDTWGTSFQFTANGRPFFAKGANWIPAHSFVNEGEALIPALLDSAVEAHMNMLRIWGGGIYELESFYEGCLERGLVIWQDFMFACNPSPADEVFMDLIRDEATYQIRRLRNHAHIALWCGNNEIEQLFQCVRDNPVMRKEYDSIFREMLPELLATLSPGTAYISSSEHNPDDPQGSPGNPESGDAHYWGVWHSRQPIEAYEQQAHRFFSEFGMQAYPHVETARGFTESRNLFGPDMDNHQKNGGGNQTIFHYIAELYRFPRDYAATVYLSQIMQAHCIRTGVEHMRRNMPRTMGSLYWQLNDCWPVASWSGIDFGGRWKALHYAAKRFYAPALLSLKRSGGEEIHTSTNTRFNTVTGAELHLVFEGAEDAKALVEWELWSIPENRVLEQDTRDQELTSDTACLCRHLDFAEQIRTHGPETLLLCARLRVEGFPDSVSTLFFTAPKRIEFPEAALRVSVSATDAPTRFQVRIESDRIAHQVYLNLADSLPHHFSDNFFDLLPGIPVTVDLEIRMEVSRETVETALRLTHYREAYLE
ncbi:MAG: glycoside hydrolase family 2 protein [Opitutales bacterium]